MIKDSASVEISESLIFNFLSKKSEDSMLKLVTHVKNNDLADECIVTLARGLAMSGLVINDINNPTCDIPSTGGPGSLSTLLCPILLKLMGNHVLKLGVPGRPAGGIDVLGQIAGYVTNPTPVQLKNWLNKNHYVHFLADQNFAPLDALLFNFRKENNCLHIPALVIASLLSKKIAVNLKYIGLDVRVSPFGNFGADNDQATKFSARFNRIASMVGIRSVCFLTNGVMPQQPFIGRGESILALKQTFAGENAHLNRHFGQLIQMAAAVSINKTINFSLTDVQNAFFQNVETQGGNSSSFHEIATRIEHAHVHTIKAESSGFALINLQIMRQIITATQQKFTGERFADPCGVILKKMPYEFVSPGDVICTYRCNEPYLKEFSKQLAKCFIISDRSPVLNDLTIIN